MDSANHADQSDRPKRSVHQLFAFDDSGVLVQRNTSEASHHIVVDDQANGNLSYEEVEPHLFDSVTLHVGLHSRSHHVVRWFYNYESV